jgi:hypothetical protein
MKPILLISALAVTSFCAGAVHAQNTEAVTFTVPPSSASMPSTGAGSYCRQPAVIRTMLAAFSSATAVKSAGEYATDFMGSTTTAMDVHELTFSCHGTFRLSNGQDFPGTFSIIRNAAGDPKWNWVNDPTDEEEEVSERAERAGRLAEEIYSQPR